MKQARRQDLRQWLRSKPKPSMVEGLGLLCALMAALVPGLTVVGGMILNSDRSNPRVFVLLLLTAAGIIVLAWSFWKQALERTKPQSPRTAAQGTRFRIGHLMVLVAEAFLICWFLREGEFKWTGSLVWLCGTVPGLMALQACYVLLGLLVARKIQAVAEQSDWPDAQAHLAVAAYAPLLVLPLMALCLVLLLDGPFVFGEFLVKLVVVAPVLWVAWAFGIEGPRLLSARRSPRWRRDLLRVAAGKVRPARTPAAKRVPGMCAPRPPAAGFSGPMDGCGRQIP